MKVAILAGGKSVARYRRNELNPQYDQVWGLNNQATWKDLTLDRCFVMDDLKMRLPYYTSFDFANWLKTYKRPIITSQAYPEWPTSENYPIKEICHEFGVPAGMAMYSSPDYMIALAIYEGATEIDLYGVDLNSDKELFEFRLGTAHWVGIAAARKVLVRAQAESILQYLTSAAFVIERGMYGYAKRPRIEDMVNPDYYPAQQCQ